MITLHIEHGISDFKTWKAAFDRFADQRKSAGATGHRIFQPHDNPAYLVLQLEFPTVPQAQSFLAFLESRVWSVPANAPALKGSPRASILVAAPQQ